MNTDGLREKPKLSSSRGFVRVNEPNEGEERQVSDVREILKENFAVDQERNPDLPLVRRRLSQRARDYLGALFFGNGFFVLILLLLPLNVFTLIYGLSGVVIFSVGLTWVMWVVMDRY